MQVLTCPGGAMHYQTHGLADVLAVVFSNSLSTDLRLWDAIMPKLPVGLPAIRYDTRGHKLSDLGRTRESRIMPMTP